MMNMYVIATSYQGGLIWRVSSELWMTYWILFLDIIDPMNQIEMAVMVYLIPRVDNLSKPASWFIRSIDYQKLDFNTNIYITFMNL